MTLQTVVAMSSQLIVIADLMDFGALSVRVPLFSSRWFKVEVEAISVLVKWDHVFIFSREPWKRS